MKKKRKRKIDQKHMENKVEMASIKTQIKSTFSLCQGCPTFFLNGPLCKLKYLLGRKFTKKRLAPTEIMGEDQKKGLHRLRRLVFTEVLGKDQKKVFTDSDVQFSL